MDNQSIWDQSNLPENHELFKNVKFVSKVEGTWKRKDKNGNDEVAPKWDYVTQETEDAQSIQISVYSSTDKEALELNKSYDIITKKAVGKDGTFYGYTLKGFAEAGTPIPKKEPQSRFQKNLKMNNRQLALQHASNYSGSDIKSPDDVLNVAELYLAWLNEEYKPIDKDVFENK